MGFYQYKKIGKGTANINEYLSSEFILEGKKKAVLMDTGMGIFIRITQTEIISGKRFTSAKTTFPHFLPTTYTLNSLATSRPQFMKITRKYGS